MFENLEIRESVGGPVGPIGLAATFSLQRKLRGISKQIPLKYIVHMDIVFYQPFKKANQHEICIRIEVILVVYLFGDDSECMIQMDVCVYIYIYIYIVYLFGCERILLGAIVYVLTISWFLLVWSRHYPASTLQSSCFDAAKQLLRCNATKQVPLKAI